MVTNDHPHERSRKRTIAPMNIDSALVAWTELFDKLADLDANDPIIRPLLTAEEVAYFDAEHDLTAALAKAATAAIKALDSQEAEDLADATFRFECAQAAARKQEQAKWMMNKAFKLSDEYLAQVAEETDE